MTRFRRHVQQFVQSETSATATEYAVMIALVILVVIKVVALLGTKVSGVFVDASKGW